tara:strand:- start:293 stop:409 length:117 start_codon:yes stop_codon:yes gene_type:complete
MKQRILTGKHDKAQGSSPDTQKETEAHNGSFSKSYELK